MAYETMAVRYSMRLGVVTLLAIALLCGVHAAAQDQSTSGALSAVKWQQGQSQAQLGSIAEIKVPEGFVFAGADDTRTLMEALENPTSGQELGFLAPASIEWFVVFEFSETGYVKDDEKGQLDAAAILRTMQANTERANEERRKRGWALISIVGWEQPPHYDAVTHNLEWAIRAESQGKPLLNYNTRLLGRTGVMRVSLVVGPDAFAATLPQFKGLLQDYSFTAGKRYAEFRAGDKLAQYGLTALITGGAAAVAVKTGLLAKAWNVLAKAIIPILVVIGVFLKRLFGKKQ